KGTPRIEPTGLAVAPAMEMPESAVLDQNYPNPFNPSTTIRYTVASPAQVSLTVFTVLGQEVATLHDGWREAGVYEATFTAQHTLGSGVLFYRLNVNGALLVRAAVLMR
ncbi:MAG TPA: T9SS type A sorting domain-containing protein, partial [Bacteroidota bacterium]|nr:T9SS type A sorting domain-containing protein [Bacteroidota bacterium]